MATLLLQPSGGTAVMCDVRVCCVVVLRDENERMRQYMECLVSKAIATCPQILCNDTQLF